jgi:hypothetical protein
VAFPAKDGRTWRSRSPWTHWPPAMRRVPPSVVGVSSWSPHHWRPPPDTLESPRSASPGAPRARRRLTSPCGCGLIARRIQVLRPGPTWDLVGQMLPPFSPGDPPTHPACHPWILAHPTDKGCTPTTPPQRFRRVRTLAHTHGRIVVPPGASRPGHCDAALAGRPWLPPPPEESARRDFCTGTNPHREDLVHTNLTV